MRYFVIAPDGTKFGPADLATLRTWIAEGRIAPDTILEEEASHQRAPARMIAGLTFAVETPTYVPQTGRNPRPEFGQRGDDGSHDILWSYICSALTMICCLPFNIGGWVYANRALKKGNRRANGAKIFAAIMLILWIVTGAITVPFMGQLYKMVMDMINSQGGSGGGGGF